MTTESATEPAAKPKGKEPPWGQKRVTEAIRERYPAPAFAIFTEVSDGTGFRTRSADALAMSLWPSRGLELTGFEIKSSRSDWRRELADPSKAEPICRYCDRWYIVTGDAGLVREGELPPTWGLIERRGSKLVAVKEAPKLDPIPFDRPFFAALVRRCHEQHDAIKLTDEDRARIRREGFEEGRNLATAASAEDRAFARNRAQQELDDLKRTVSRFEQESGVKIGTAWNDNKIGNVVAYVLATKSGGVLSQLLRDMEETARKCEKLRAVIGKAVEEFREGASPC